MNEELFYLSIIDQIGKTVYFQKKPNWNKKMPCLT